MTPGQQLRKLEKRVNARSLRERALLLIAALAVAFLLADSFFLRPLDNRRETTRQQLDQTSSQVADLTGTIEMLAGRNRSDPDAELVAERDSLQQRVSALRTELADLDSGLMSPQQTLDQLRELLAERDDLELISLQKLAAQPLDPARKENGIFVHRFSMVIESDYFGILNYIRLIETLPRGLYWESLDLSVPEWPKNRGDVVLYMLALDEDWLGV